MTETKPLDGIGVIRQEHRNLAKVLKFLEAEAQRYQTTGAAPDFGLLDSVFAYVDGFLNTQHHPKENLYLFAELRLRRPDIAGTLDLLERQHRDGALVLARARAAAKSLMDTDDRAAFRQAVARYCQFEFDHMRLEEDTVIPAAEESLTAADKAVMDRAFTDNHHDPLFGAGRSAEFERLFEFVRARCATGGVGNEEGEEP
ncbi:MAG: hemerythrin domain-containing protein [Rhodospirillales bacterium]